MISILNSVLRPVCAGLFAFLLIVMVWQVFARQILNDAPAWTGPAAQYAFIWLVFAGAAWMFAEREHIAIDFFTKMLKIDRTRSLEVFVNLMSFAFAVLLLIWGGVRAVEITWTQAIPGLPFSTGQMFLVVPISGVLIALISLRHAVEAIRTGETAGDNESTEAI